MSSLRKRFSFGAGTRTGVFKCKECVVSMDSFGFQLKSEMSHEIEILHKFTVEIK